MSVPLTTVVIPAFNAENYVDRTIASATHQTFRNLEIILVNDGSTDSTEWIANSFAEQDRRIRVITTANRGVACARNRGIEEASGEFVAFLDADDLWHPEKIEDQVSALSCIDGERAAATYAQMRIIDWEDRVIRNGSGVACSGSVFARHLFSRPVGNGSSLLVRRKTALELGGFDPSWLARDIGGCEDLDFELKIASKYPVIGIRRYLVGYRSHGENMSIKGLTLAKSIIATVEQHIQEHPELTSWAVRKIRGATLEFALKSIANSGDWTTFASHLAKLQRTDPVRGFQYTFRNAVRKLLPSVHAPIRPASKAGQRPFFYELSPDQDVDPAGQPRWRDRRVIERLSAVDARRAADLIRLY